MIQLNNFLSLSEPVLHFHGNAEHPVKEMLQLTDDHFNGNSLAWCSDKNKETLLSIKTGSIILSELSYIYVKEQHPNLEEINWLVVDNPRRFFSLVLNTFFVKKRAEGIIESSAIIHPSVTVPTNCYIGHHVVIEEGVEIGENCFVHHHSSILEGTVLKDYVSVGANCTIGGVGFGYEMKEDGSYEVIPHIGNVVLNEYVEIGNNVCIDRAVLGSTILERNVKVDNLVHIAHGVRIGENSLIIANAMVAGSVTIGKNVWIAPSSSIIQKTNIGDNALIGLNSTVLKDVEASVIVAGSPAKKIKNR